MQKRTPVRPHTAAPIPGDSEVTACLAVTLALVLVTLLVLALSGCQTAPTVTILPGSDNVTVTATIATEDERLAELLPYAVLANEEISRALTVYEATKDATALQQVAWWLQYALGVAQHIEALSQTQT